MIETACDTMALFKPRDLLPLIDLTRLNDVDTDEAVSAFFHNAIRPIGHVASVCVMPQFVTLAKARFRETPVKVCTVANFPSGDMPEEEVLTTIREVVQAGADEVDVVFSYQRFLSGDTLFATTFLQACRQASAACVLKVILETGALATQKHIEAASEIAILAGADFVKTSTGKIKVGATPEAALAMLHVIARFTPQLKRKIGLKVSGGVREIKDALQYVALAKKIMGDAFINPATFRIGASLLVEAIQ